MDGFEIQVWDGEKKTRWRELLPAWYNFWVNEPLNSAAIGDIEEGETKIGLEKMMYDQLLSEDLPAIVAYDSKNSKVAGVVFSVVDNVKDQNQTSKELDEVNSKSGDIKAWYNYRNYPFNSQQMLKLEEIGSFLQQLAAKGDVCEIYGVDKVWVIQNVSVCPEYTRQGLATKMIAKVIETAKETGFQLVMSEATSQYIQHTSIKNFQFEKILDISMEENYANYFNMPDEMKRVHSTVAVLVKCL